MGHFVYPLIFVWLSLIAGCLPVSSPPPQQTPSSPPVPTVEAGPYWHQTSETASLADAMAYYAALKTLTSDELGQEHQRLLAAIDSAETRIANVQLLLLACLPGQTLVDSAQAVKLLETARQDASLHREMGNLFILLNDQLTSRVATPKTQEQDCGQALRTARKKAKAQGAELSTCREERDDLAGKLKKLQDIERGLLDRERKK